MASGETWTVGKLLTWTADYLKKNGAESPRLDADVLLAEARGTTRLALYTAFDEIVADDVRAKFRGFVKQRAEGTPVAYIVGRKEFYSLTFHITPDVLIPRPETEHVVIAALDVLKARGGDAPPAYIADVCTGSGCIAVALAKHAPTAHVVATDLSPAAIEVARRNAATHQVSERVECIECDLLAGVAPQHRFDVIVSNPPYVTAGEWESLPREVRDHEPRLALIGGTTGLEITARLVEQAAGFLAPGGWLILEIHSGHAPQTQALLEHSGAFEQVSMQRDLAQLPRVVLGRRK